MKYSPLVPAAVLSYLLSGCASPQKLAAIDEQFNAGWRPSALSCLFGGATQKVNRYCATVHFDTEGTLSALNASVIRSLGAADDCTDHARAALRSAKSAGYQARKIYSCPDEQDRQDGICHVSVVVTDAEGRQWVMDNGAVLTETHSRSHVDTLEAFAAEVRNEYWIGMPPTVVDMRFASTLRTLFGSPGLPPPAAELPP